MARKDWFGIAYVSFWVLIWGSLGSFIDFPLLKAGIYFAGSIGQVSTFLITGIISIVVAIFLYPRVLSNLKIKNLLKLDD